MKHSSDKLSMKISRNLHHMASTHVNISSRQHRKRRSKKSIHYTMLQSSTTLTPSKHRMVSMAEATSSSTSIFRLPQATLSHMCMSDGEASYELRDSRETKIQEKPNHFLCSEDYLGEYCVHSRSAEVEESLGDNGTQKFDQDNVSLRESQMIQTPRKISEAVIADSPSPASTHDQIRNQDSGSSGTDPSGRTAGDHHRASICICKTLIGAPSRAEIEEFFADIAERCKQKLLTARYNFDFKKDVPLQGRYEWISLTPS
ncbi:hypothetical protein O6H91_17G072100 [Diphasiastrum complanatum]|uniref:Uncharacterized protein n=1 Tax=Diphasiastrum complanatum TaxID=34168 RepID=A0ACC2B7X7_DIPCM|nr:hypothetical protein O6H91_17G072100 [Diphasiastrum complanatum]